MQSCSRDALIRNGNVERLTIRAACAGAEARVRACARMCACVRACAHACVCVRAWARVICALCGRACVTARACVCALTGVRVCTRGRACVRMWESMHTHAYVCAYVSAHESESAERARGAHLCARASAIMCLRSLALCFSPSKPEPQILKSRTLLWVRA
eukprot:6207816-Pleurochrysis_carterae.AAC.1